MASTEPTVATDPALTVAFLKVLSDYFAAKYREVRAEQEARMKRGDRLTARDPQDDTKLASVTLTDPKKYVSVTDADAFTQWMVDNYPALTETVTEINASDAMVKSVLFQHAPELLTYRRRVRPSDLGELKAACVTLGAIVGPGAEADVPGLELRESEPVIQCRPTDDALPRLLHLFREGVIRIDGTVLPTIAAAS